MVNQEGDQRVPRGRSYQSHISPYYTAVPAKALSADTAARATMVRASARAVLRNTMFLLCEDAAASSYDAMLAPVLARG